MKYYSKLSSREKLKVDEMIEKTVEVGHHINEHNGYEWDEPNVTLQAVHNDEMCAECLMNWYNCVCSHDDE